MHPLIQLLLKWGAFGTSLQELWIAGNVPSGFSKMLTYRQANHSFYCCLLDLQEPWESHWLLFEHMLVQAYLCRAKECTKNGCAILSSILTDFKGKEPVNIWSTCCCSLDTRTLWIWTDYLQCEQCGILLTSLLLPLQRTILYCPLLCVLCVKQVKPRVILSWNGDQALFPLE